jgi:hypothetical protein
MSDRVCVTSISHVQQEIACSPEILYQYILATYVQGDKFSEQNYLTVPLPETDLAGFRGGYSVTLKNDRGELVDHRICRITERDDDSRRVSLRAEYLLPAAHRAIIHATYQAVPSSKGARYQLDAHADMNLEAPADSSRASMAEIVSGYEKQAADYLRAYLGQVKVTLEQH